MKRLQGKVAVGPGGTAGTSVGFAVGCDDPSQFSFEYTVCTDFRLAKIRCECGNPRCRTGWSSSTNPPS